MKDKRACDIQLIRESVSAMQYSSIGNTYVYTYTCKRSHSRTRMNIHTSTRVCLYVCVCNCICPYVYLRMYFMCVRISVYICTCMGQITPFNLELSNVRKKYVFPREPGEVTFKLLSNWISRLRISPPPLAAPPSP